MNEIFIEAESFNDKGGWVVDQQSMETLRSSYLMAHGLGVPVSNANTTINVCETANYHVWVRTRDWTSVWDVKDSAGKFKLLIDGESLPTILGTNGKDWAWQKAGVKQLTSGLHTLTLHDLTGFNGRVDAIYLTTSCNTPTENIEDMRKRLNWQVVQNDNTLYDLIVVGGGIAGMCMALSAIRCGVKTLLIHDRDILGGCNSSEIRVCMGGKVNLAPYPNLGNVVKEIAPIMGFPTLFNKEYFEDNRKLFAFEVSNATNCIRFNECVTEATENNSTIDSVITTNTLTGKKTCYRAKLFADCSGDATLSRLVNATTMYGRESRDTFNESLAPKQYERFVMGHSIRWYSKKSDVKTNFPNIDWGLAFNDKTCLNVRNGDWEQESGFYKDMVNEIEYIRDFGLRAIFSNWSYQKNLYSKKEEFAYDTLCWASHLGGKRESYRVEGDIILTQNDIENHIIYDDATACMTWEIDMHFPEPDNLAEFKEPFRSFAYHRGYGKPYPIPYRCLYSKDIKNLFLGGRIVSASHVAFSGIRVMRTLGQLGEVVGIASGICIKNNCFPRDIYTSYLQEFTDKLKEGVEIPQAFGFDIDNCEKYHFKDIGWLNLNPYSCNEEHLDKFKRSIKALDLQHKYPLPDKLK